MRSLLLLLLLLLSSVSSFNFPTLPFDSPRELGTKVNEFYDAKVQSLPFLPPQNSDMTEIPSPVYAELPNPIIPVIFTLVLIIGIGILTSSLGDVVGEEAMTGDRAGYKAQKESEKRNKKFLDFKPPK
ncbi:hypothetical protein TrLO_g5973 [Triparma laevis f. longispina]|uniref:Transmembrane protein n=1 Tax=Triparma laevis f. longispina TaxID=1714387 RepID=A0A9W7FGX5_9STRA|nr:hypothetical protein TrLO_g5973 [Triparma laevis f. longispina]